MFDELSAVPAGSYSLKGHALDLLAMQPAERVDDEVLTQREIEVLCQVSRDNSNKIIAAELALSERTIKGSQNDPLETWS